MTALAAPPRQCSVDGCTTLEVARGRCYLHGAPDRTVATVRTPDYVPEKVAANAQRLTQVTAEFNRERQRRRTRTTVPSRWDDAS